MQLLFSQVTFIDFILLQFRNHERRYHTHLRAWGHHGAAGFGFLDILIEIALLFRIILASRRSIEKLQWKEHILSPSGYTCNNQ